jgi:hypothetical protein
MKKFYFLFLAFIATTTFSFAQNELSNESFENWTGTGSTDVPLNWHGDRSNIALSAVTEITTDAQDGSSAVALTVESTSHKRFTNEAIIATNEEYKLSYYYKGNGQLRNAYHDGSYSTYESYTDVNTTTWTLMEYTFTPNAGNLEVIFSVRNTSGDGVLIDNVTLLKTATLSNKNFETSEFSVYPNPVTNGFVNIKTTSNDAINVTVFDVLGKQVVKQTLTTNRLNVSNLKAGMYLLNIEQNGASTTKKLVIE